MDLDSIEIININDEKGEKSIISISIENFSESFSSYVKENLIRFYDGRDSGYDYKTVFKKILKFFESKTNINHLNGAVSEFLLLIIFSSLGFSQEYCYQDLDGGGLKKGFDGLFTKDNNMWLMESKSSSEKNAHNMNHTYTINNAYRDIKSRIESGRGNDPWQNAYNHAIKASSEKTLLNKLRELSTKFVEGKFGKIKDENIILGSTVYNDPVTAIDNSDTSIKLAIKGHETKKQIVVAINMIESKLILDFIRGLLHE